MFSNAFCILFFMLLYNTDGSNVRTMTNELIGESMTFLPSMEQQNLFRKVSNGFNDIFSRLIMDNIKDLHNIALQINTYTHPLDDQTICKIKHIYDILKFSDLYYLKLPTILQLATKRIVHEINDTNGTNPGAILIFNFRRFKHALNIKSMDLSEFGQGIHSDKHKEFDTVHQVLLLSSRALLSCFGDVDSFAFDEHLLTSAQCNIFKLIYNYTFHYLSPSFNAAHVNHLILHFNFIPWNMRATALQQDALSWGMYAYYIDIKETLAETFGSHGLSDNFTKPLSHLIFCKTYYRDVLNFDYY
eukprot:1041998_1